MGQYGALGNGTYVQAQGNPVKVKVLSGNIMCTLSPFPITFPILNFLFRSQ